MGEVIAHFSGYIWEYSCLTEASKVAFLTVLVDCFYLTVLIVSVAFEYLFL